MGANTAGGIHDNLLIVMLRAPILGTVKSRLAAEIGAKAALGAYKMMLTTVLDRLESIDSKVFCITPDESAGTIKERASQARAFWNQGTGDLGIRMRRALERAFDGGAKRVVVIGVDCPEVSAAHIQAAWQALESLDLVTGPATDGGYWLIGLRRPQAELFANMPWGTGEVGSRTLAIAKKLGLKVAQLETLSDIDTMEDWKSYQQRARRLVHRARESSV